MEPRTAEFIDSVEASRKLREVLARLREEIEGYEEARKRVDAASEASANLLGVVERAVTHMSEAARAFNAQGVPAIQEDVAQLRESLSLQGSRISLIADGLVELAEAQRTQAADIATVRKTVGEHEQLARSQGQKIIELRQALDEAVVESEESLVETRVAIGGVGETVKKASTIAAWGLIISCVVLAFVIYMALAG